MVLFTHLKIILSQCFQFLVFNKISCIQWNSLDDQFIDALRIEIHIT